MSLVNLVCEVGLPSVSVSDYEIVEPQENESKHGGSADPVGAQENASEGGA